RREPPSRCAPNPSRSPAALKSMAIGRSIRPKRPPASLPRPSRRRCMTSGSGICAKSAIRAMHGIGEWEELRALASAIKEHTLPRLDEYLGQFEANAHANGVHVHWVRGRRAQPHPARHPPRPRRQVADSKQVDADQGMRVPALQDLADVDFAIVRTAFVVA